MRATVLDNGDTSDSFPVTNGVRQKKRNILSEKRDIGMALKSVSLPDSPLGKRPTSR